MKNVRRIAAIILLSIGIGFITSYILPSYYLEGTSKSYKVSDKKKFDSWSSYKHVGFNIGSFTLGCGCVLVIGGLYLTLVKDNDN